MKPLFIWAGGKTKVLKHYKDFLPSASSFSNYYEPFFGGGAMFVYVMNTRSGLCSFIAWMNIAPPPKNGS